MSSITLRDYVAACLPESIIDADRLTAFLAQTDIAGYVAQMEQLTGQIVAAWPPKPAAYSFIEPVAFEQSISVVADEPTTLPLTQIAQPEPTAPVAPPTPVGDETTPAFSFLASEEEVDQAIQASQPVADDPAQVSPVYDITPTPAAPPQPASDDNTPALTPTPPPVGDDTPVLSQLPDEVSTPAPLPSATDEVTTQPIPDPVRFAPTNRPEPSTPPPMRTISIPNATVGKVYAYRFDFDALGLPEPTDHTLSLDATTGLTYDRDTRTINGIPVEAGEFSFELSYRQSTDEPHRPALNRRIQLLINPDPRSLWKDLPSDTTDPYYKPDSARNLLSVGDMRLIAASVRGRSHAHEGKFRDDDFNLAYFADRGWYLLTVADGAGSAQYSRRGAQLACQTVTAYLQDTVDPQRWTALEDTIAQYKANRQEPVAGAVRRELYDILGKAVFAAYKAIESEAQTKEADAKDYATTLITTLAKPVAGGWFIGAFWVGDGGIGIYQTDREPIVLGTADGGEYAGQTRFLTMSETISNNFFGRFQFALVPDFTAVVLMTDGITDPKFQTDANLGRKEKWDDLWADLNQGVSFADDAKAPTQLLDWLTFWSPGNHDDRTIALLYTHGGNAKN